MQNLKKFNNSEYNPGNKIIRILWYIASRFFFNTFLPFPYWFKSLLLRLFGSKVGTNVVIKPYVKIKYPWFLSIGDNSWIGEGVWIDNLYNVHIGNDVCVSQGAMFISGSHDYKKETFDLILKKILIEDYVWICANAKILQGVTVSKGSVLTASSVAVSNLAENGVFSGNPAELIHPRRRL